MTITPTEFKLHEAVLVRAHFANQPDAKIEDYVCHLYEDLRNDPQDRAARLVWELLLAEIRSRPSLGNEFVEDLLHITAIPTP